jgi:hypothetical protein
MHEAVSPVEPEVDREVFETWTIRIPTSFSETFVDEDAYWHGWDDNRSVSLTGMLIWSPDGPVPGALIADVLPDLVQDLHGVPLDVLPPGVHGRAAVAPAIQPARASTIVSGVLAVDGHLLIVTITADDLDWARRTWLSIRRRAASAESRVH